jgi:hypothetical protein
MINLLFTANNEKVLHSDTAALLIYSNINLIIPLAF